MQGTTFYVDEWSAIFQYGWSPGTLLQPVNGHNAFTGRLTWNLTMALFGIHHYLPFRLLGLSFNLFTAAALFFYARSRHSQLAASCLAALSLGLGSSFHTILWPASAIGVFSMGALPLCLYLFDRQDRRSSGLAVLLLLITLGTGAMGLVVLGACLVEMLLRRRFRQLLLLAVPMGLYCGWVMRFGGESSSGTSLRTLLDAPAYVQQAFAAAAAGLLGFGTALTATAATLYLLALGVASYVNRVNVDWPRMSSIASAALAFWGLTAAFRGPLGEAGAPRYIAFGSLPLGLLLVESTRGMRVTRGARRIVVGVVAASLLSNVAALLIAEENFRYIGDIQRAELAALESVRGTVDPGYVIPGEWSRYVRADEYFRAVDRFGSPAVPQDELATGIPAARVAADEVLLAGRALAAEPPASVSPETRACNAAGPSVDLPPGGAVLLRTGPSPVEVRARWLADTPPEKPSFTVPANSTELVRAAPSSLGRAWKLSLSGAAQFCVS
jgi:hypothetical protein